MSADGRSSRLEEGTGRDRLGNRLALAVAAGMKGWRPSANSSRRVRAKKRGCFFLRSAHFALPGPDPRLTGRGRGTERLGSPFRDLRPNKSVGRGAQRGSGAQTASALRLLSNRRKTEPGKQRYPPPSSGRGVGRRALARGEGGRATASRKTGALANALRRGRTRGRVKTD
jgi:hypothetical protein